MVRSPWQSFEGRGKSNLGRVKVSTGTVTPRQKSTRSQEKQSTEENETSTSPLSYTSYVSSQYQIRVKYNRVFFPR